MPVDNKDKLRIKCILGQLKIGANVYKLAKIAKAISEKNKGIIWVVGGVIFSASIFFGWASNYFVRVDVGTFVAHVGGLGFLVFSYLVNETNKNNAVRAEKVRRCEKIEEMIYEDLDADVGVLMPSVSINKRLKHLLHLEQVLGSKRYKIKNGSGSVSINELSPGFFSAVSCNEHFDVKDSDIPELERLWKEYQGVVMDVEILNQDILKLHVDLIRKVNLLSDYVRSAKIKYKDLEDPMKKIEESLGKINNVYHDRLDNLVDAEGAVRSSDAIFNSGANGNVRDEADAQIRNIIENELRPVFGRLDESYTAHSFLSKICYFIIFILISFSSSYAIFYSNEASGSELSVEQNLYLGVGSRLISMYSDGVHLTHAPVGLYS